MKLKKLIAAGLLGLMSLSVGIAAPIKIGYSDWPGFTILEVAKQKGWFKDAGLDVELVWFEYSPSIDAFAAGKVDGVTIVAGDDMVTGASGAKSKIVCLLDFSEGSDMIIGVPGIESIKDLKGKKIGIELTLVEHELLLQALKANGMSQSDVTLVGTATDKTPQALASGQVSAVGAWYPLSGQALKTVRTTARSLSFVTILDRYIFRSVLFTCAAAVALFAFIVIVPNIVRDLLAYVLTGQLSLFIFGKLVLLLLPFAITYALPMGMLTGVLLTLGRLSADSEITAMRAAGIGVNRVARPVLFLAALGSVTGLYFNFESMPRARVAYHEELTAAVRSNPLSLITPKTFIRDFPGRVIYVGDKQGSILRDLWYWELDSERRVKQVVRAESGHIDYDEDNNSFVLTLTHVQAETRNDKDPENFTSSPFVASFDKFEPVRLSLDRFFGRASGIHVKQEWMTYGELRRERDKLDALPVPADKTKARQGAMDRMKLELIYQDKFNTALAVLSLTLIGVPLGIKVSRRETSANFAVAVGITLAYYLLTMSVKVLDRHPEYRPDLLLWLPNIILLAAGLWLVTRIERK